MALMNFGSVIVTSYGLSVVSAPSSSHSIKSEPSSGVAVNLKTTTPPSEAPAPSAVNVGTKVVSLDNDPILFPLTMH